MPRHATLYTLCYLHTHTHIHTERGESSKLRRGFVPLMNLQRDSIESPFTYMYVINTTYYYCPPLLALIAACLCCVAHSYPQFQCDSGTQWLTGGSETFYNRFGTGQSSDCDINNCHWLWGWILKDTDNVNNADCESCTADEGNFNWNIPKENSQNLWICPRHCHAMPQINV